MSFFSSDSFYILSKAFVFVKNFFIFLLLFVSHSSASLRQLIYVITFKLFCQPLFKISYKFLSSLLINLFFELFLSQGLSASAPSSYSSVCSVVFSAVLSDECYLIIVISNCYPPVWGRLPTRYSPVRHSVTKIFIRRIKSRCFVRLACVKHAASVHPEPGSNSR